MILTTIEELRLYFPSHAINHIEPMASFLDNSEADFLLQPLGQPLYDKLTEYYDGIRNDKTIGDLIDQYSKHQLKTDYMAQLLFMAQRCIAFDAFASAIDVQAISINNAGVNIATADDYGKVDEKAMAAFKASCRTEAHKALNRLLYTLEQWVKACPSDNDATADDADLLTIVKFWRQSRYYYLAASMLVPSAVVMQEYLNIYDSREKFIQLLPDLRFIQEEQVANAIGEDFLEVLVAENLKDADEVPAVLRRIIHRLRKVIVTFVESRTSVLKVDSQRKIAARDEAVRLLDQLTEYCQVHQSSVLDALDTLAGITSESTDAEREEARAPYVSSPLYQAPAADTQTDTGKIFDNQSSDAAMFVTEPLL